MKITAKRTGLRLFPIVAAGAIALAVSGCGDEPQSKPAARTAAPPTVPQPQVEARPAPEKPAAESALAASDQALAARVKSALAAAPGLNTHRIDVTARDGAVTLFGTAETKAQRETAGKAAAAVAGVKSVENKLAIVAGS